jgi:hypothetical protein
MKQVKTRSESLSCREDEGYVNLQLRERHQDLVSLESEYESSGMSLSEYSSCRRSLFQAIVELETLLKERDASSMVLLSPVGDSNQISSRSRVTKSIRL